MWLYGFTTFLSAFLIFQVQMLLGKYILPWYGGVPAVWATCMLFFQTALLAGYAYAHTLAARPAPATQRTVHLLMVLGAIGVLGLFAIDWGWPLLPDAAWRPMGSESPILHILLLLTAAVGAPFITLAATAPLVQRWFSLTHPGVSPYRLYALSNVGSLAGLLSYPFVVEVWVPLRAQALLWSLGYGAFAVGIVACAWQVAKVQEKTPARDERAGKQRPTHRQLLLWFSLSACGSTLLLAITNQMSQEVAVVPFLWVLPLALYLLSFVLTFAGERWYPRQFYLALFVPALCLVTLAMQRGVEGSLTPQIFMYSAALFVMCMVCHGELVRRTPPPAQLTAFYLSISAGGAAGGVLVAILAPLVFPGMWELSIALVVSAALVAWIVWRDKAGVALQESTHTSYVLLASVLLLALLVYSEPATEVAATAAKWLRARPAAALAVLLIVVAAIVLLRARRARLATLWQANRNVLSVTAISATVLLFAAVHAGFVVDTSSHSIEVSRNFFGVLRVDAARDDAGATLIKLRHGRTVHGLQYLDGERRLQPTSYYTENSGIGLALRNHAQHRAGRPLRVGVIGLGVGTLAAYGRPGDHFRFYEIDPDVVRLATGAKAPFSYVRRSRAEVSVALGDARITLERETPQLFDVLALDAFSSGSIPAHLLTREAFAVYARHLAPQRGVLALHVSNRYLDLEPLVATLVREQGWVAGVVRHPEPLPAHIWGSTWILIAARAEWLPPQAEALTVEQAVVWTDDYSNLLQSVRWSRREEGSPAETMKQINEEARYLDPLR